ncbi:MAG: hypothetical protein PWQ77_551 [Kosmotogales bacterium]|nr:hypothetical protein [Kosmotogales bacterium]
MKKILLVVLLVALVGIFSFSRVLDSAAKEALTGNEFVQVSEEKDYLIFEPTVDSKDVGLIFYPQSNVEKEAYSVAGMEFAEEGFTVFVLESGAGFEESNAIIEGNSQIGIWVIGGHGEGGNMAAEFVESHSALVEDGVVEGLLLWGSDAATVDLTDFTADNDLELQVLSIYGSEDTITTVSEIRNLRSLLPDDTTAYVYIAGGNNSNYANFGLIDGDKNVSISVEEQQEIAFRYTKNLLNKINGGGTFSISVEIK